MNSFTERYNRIKKLAYVLGVVIGFVLYSALVVAVTGAPLVWFVWRCMQ